eukprot:gene14837-biopygen8324
MGSAKSAVGPSAEHAAQRWESAGQLWRSSGGGSLQCSRSAGAALSRHASWETRSAASGSGGPVAGQQCSAKGVCVYEPRP